jgi:2'-hydroxyisoflavone reductase
MALRNNSKGIASGLTFRPLTETIADTLKWWQTDRADSELKAGMREEREEEILRASTDSGAQRQKSWRSV